MMPGHFRAVSVQLPPPDGPYLGTQDAWRQPLMISGPFSGRIRPRYSPKLGHPANHRVKGGRP